MKQFAPFILLLWPLWAFTHEDDTTFQIARVRTLQEVLIKAEEPSWIREKLNSKSRRYQMQERLRKVPRQYVLLKE